MTGTLKQVYDEHVKMDNGVTAMYKRVLDVILKNVIDNMKEKNATFNELYSRIYYTGSFYDGLKVGSSELEFDLNIVFNIGDYHVDIVDLGTDTDKPNFGFLRFTKAHPTEDERSVCFEKDGERYLSPEKMFQLIKRSADRALTESFRGQDFTVTRSIGAPYTLKVSGVFDGEQVKCAIDLVPAIELNIDRLPVDGSNDIFDRVHKMKDAFPCPQRDFMAISLWKVDSNKSELDFHNIERGILYKKGCVKTVVKLIKHLRDVKGGPFMKLWSHLIKTVVMHQVIKNKADKTYWNEVNLERCFINSLNALYDCLNVGIISDIFFPTFNLLSKIKQSQVINDTKQWLCSSLKMYQETRDANRMFDDRMEAGQRNSEINDMLDVQLQKFAESFRTYHISVDNIDKCLSFNQMTSLPLMPDYILRDPQGSVLQDNIQSMLSTLAGFTYANMPSRNIQDQVKGFVNKMSGVNVEWVPCSWHHDKKAVTLVVPINDAQKRVLLLSFDFYEVNK